MNKYQQTLSERWNFYYSASTFTLTFHDFPCFQPTSIIASPTYCTKMCCFVVLCHISSSYHLSYLIDSIITIHNYPLKTGVCVCYIYIFPSNGVFSVENHLPGWQAGGPIDPSTLASPSYNVVLPPRCGDARTSSPADEILFGKYHPWMIPWRVYWLKSMVKWSSRGNSVDGCYT